MGKFEKVQITFRVVFSMGRWLPKHAHHLAMFRRAFTNFFRNPYDAETKELMDCIYAYRDMVIQENEKQKALFEKTINSSKPSPPLLFPQPETHKMSPGCRQGGCSEIALGEGIEYCWDHLPVDNSITKATGGRKKFWHCTKCDRDVMHYETRTSHGTATRCSSCGRRTHRD